MTTYTWVDGASGSVSDGANWVGGVAPGPTDDVVISGTGTETLQVDGAATVANVTLSNPNATLAIADNGSLSTTGSFTDTTLKQITLGANAHLEVGSGQVILDLLYGTALSLGAGAVLQLDAPGARLTLQTSVTLTGDATLQVGAGGSIYAVGSNIDLGSHTLTVTGGPFDNRGGITVRSGGHLVVPGGFVNLAAADPGDPLGIVAFENGSETLSSGVVNDGVLIVDGGTLEVGPNADGLALPGSGEIDLLYPANFIHSGGILQNNIFLEAKEQFGTLYVGGTKISLTYGPSDGFTGSLFGVLAGDSIHLNFDPASFTISDTAITLSGQGPLSNVVIKLGAPLGPNVSAKLQHEGAGGSDLIFTSPLVPAAPTDLADSAVVNGYVNAARAAAAQTLTGVAEPGMKVTLYDGTDPFGFTTASNSGAWSFTFDYPREGAHSLTATATNSAGIEGPVSNALDFIVDTVVQVPTLQDAAELFGHVIPERNTAAQALTGTAEAGATVTIHDGAALVGTTTAGSSGAWSYTLGVLATGGYSLTAAATDLAGNVSADSFPLIFTVDTATTHAWRDNYSGSVTRAGNWSGDSPPGPSDNATISGTSTVTVLVDVPATVESVLLFNAKATLTIADEAGLHVQGDFTASAVKQIGIGAGATLEVGSGHLTLDNTTLSLGSSALLQLDAAGATPPVLTLGTQLSLQLTGDAAIQLGGSGGSVENEGTIHTGAHVLTVAGGQFLNDGQLFLEGGGVAAPGGFVNDGLVQISNGAYIATGPGVVNDGTVSVMAGSGLLAYADASGHALPGTGTVDLDNAVFALFSGQMTSDLHLTDANFVLLTYGATDGFGGKIYGLGSADVIHLNFDPGAAAVSAQAITLTGGATPAGSVAIGLGSPLPGGVSLILQHDGAGGADLIFA